MALCQVSNPNMLHHISQKFDSKKCGSKHSSMRFASNNSSACSMSLMRSARSLLRKAQDDTSTILPCSTSRALSYHGVACQNSNVSCAIDLPESSSDAMPSSRS